MYVKHREGYEPNSFPYMGTSLITPNVVAVTVGLTLDWATASVYLVEPTWFSNRKTLEVPQSPEAAEALHDHSKLGYGIRPLDT